MLEIWKDIDGYENYYQISNWGRVKSLWFNKELELKPSLSKDGYLRVCLYKDGVKKSHQIHRIVARAFIENPNNYTQINHIDEDKINNKDANLEWCTVKYNNNYGTRNKRISKAHSIEIIGVNVEDSTIINLDASIEGGKYGFDHSSIIKCCRGKRKTHKGYTWRYV